MFRPFRGHLQADNWNILGSIHIMCRSKISLLHMICILPTILTQLSQLHSACIKVLFINLYQNSTNLATHCHDRQNRWFFQFNFSQKWYPTLHCFQCWRHVVSFIFYTCGKACMPVPSVQVPLFFFLASVQRLLPSPSLFLIPFLPGYPLLNHFTLLPSVVCILCILWLFISPSTFCIHLL